MVDSARDSPIDCTVYWDEGVDEFGVAYPHKCFDRLDIVQIGKNGWVFTESLRGKIKPY